MLRYLLKSCTEKGLRFEINKLYNKGILFGTFIRILPKKKNAI